MYSNTKNIRAPFPRPDTSAEPTLTCEAQTRLTWLKVVPAAEQIPQAYKDAFAARFERIKAFPYTLLTPSYAGFLRPANEKLVCCTDDRLVIFEKQQNSTTFTDYAFNEIAYVEMGTILLSSWLTIHGIKQNSRPSVTIIRFNTVGEELILPILKKIRFCIKSPANSGFHIEQSKFDYLSRLNFKFMNYGRSSIRPGDRVLQIILQPELRTKILALFGRTFSRFVLPAQLVILTDKEVITIRNCRKIAKYGSIWNYISLGKIAGVQLVEKGTDQLTLHLELHGNETVEILFELSKQVEAALLLCQIKGLLAK